MRSMAGPMGHWANGHWRASEETRPENSPSR